MVASVCEYTTAYMCSTTVLARQHEIHIHSWKVCGHLELMGAVKRDIVINWII